VSQVQSRHGESYPGREDIIASARA
jgi:hypothetical protein